MQVPPTYARVGPQVFPYLIALALRRCAAPISPWNAWAPGATREIRAPRDSRPTGGARRSSPPASSSRSLHHQAPGLRDRRGAFLFLCVAFAFGSRRFLRDARRRHHPGRSSAISASRAASACNCRPGILAGTALAMDALASLLQGFETALTPINLLWCLLGVTLGTAIGILPGIGPALTIALLLPVTAKLDPTGAFIMFAGLYYGAMYGSSTTSILLNTPGESGSIITAIEGNVMAKQGRGAAALATAAIGSFVAGTLGTIALTFLAPLFVKLALLFGPAEYFALMVLAFTTVSALLGASLVARPGQPAARPRHRPGRHRRADRPAAAHLRHPEPAARHRHRRRRGRPLRGRRSALHGLASRSARRRDHPDPRLAVHDARGMAALLEAVAARHRARLSLRRAAGRRHRDPDLPLLFPREAAARRSRRNSARAPSKASPARRPPTMPPWPACSCRC